VDALGAASAAAGTSETRTSAFASVAFTSGSGAFSVVATSAGAASFFFYRCLFGLFGLLPCGGLFGRRDSLLHLLCFRSTPLLGLCGLGFLCRCRGGGVCRRLALAQFHRHGDKSKWESV